MKTDLSYRRSDLREWTMEHLFNFFKSHYVPELGLMSPTIVMTAKEMAAIVERGEASVRSYLATMVERNLLVVEKIKKTVNGVDTPAFFVKVIDFQYRREPPRPRARIPVETVVVAPRITVVPVPAVSPKQEEKAKTRKTASFKREKDVAATKAKLLAIMKDMYGNESNRAIAKLLGKSVSRTKSLISELRKERRLDSVYKRHFLPNYNGWSNDRFFWVN